VTGAYDEIAHLKATITAMRDEMEKMAARENGKQIGTKLWPERGHKEM